MSNHTASTEVCHKKLAPEDPPPLIQHGKFIFQTHHIGYIISGVFTLIATGVSFWLISKHLQWYTNKREQRYIVRLLFMVPLYAIISFASFMFWNQSTPIILVRDAYEAIVLTAFFYLLLMYISHDPEEQKRVFLKKGLSKEADLNAVHRGVSPAKWVFPMGFIKSKPRDGLYFLQLMKWGVLQYCVIRPSTTLAAVILDYMGLYCESSWGLGWGHIWITILVSLSVTVAMYCLIQLYVPVSKDLAQHKPLLKLFSVKAVVFLTFWQATFLSVLSMFGVVKDTEYMTAEDINIGIGALLETFEMMLFAFLHIWAFTYQPYRLAAIKVARGQPPTRTPQWRSLGHAMDFRETFREIWIGCVYLYDKIRGKEPKLDVGAKRSAHYEVAFGRSRFPQSLSPQGVQNTEKMERKFGNATLPSVEIEVDRAVEVEVEGQRQWLGLGKGDRYGLHPGREKSEGLEEQIDHELERLGYPKLNQGESQPAVEVKRSKTNSWWRNLYNRISQSGQDDEGEHERFIQRKSTKRRSYQPRARTENDQDVGGRPPRSALYPSRAPRSGSTAFNEYEQDRLSSRDDHPMLPPSIINDGYMRQNRRQGPYLAGPSSPSTRSPSNPSVGHFNRQVSPTRMSPPHGSSGANYSPIRNHGDPPPGAAPGGRNRPRSSYIPSRDALVFPQPLSIHHSPEIGIPQGQEHHGQWGPAPRPPPAPSKRYSQPLIQAFLSEESSHEPHALSRNSTHYREPASAPFSLARDYLQVSSTQPAVRYSGLPTPSFGDERTYLPQIAHIEHPSSTHSPHAISNDLQ